MPTQNENIEMKIEQMVTEKKFLNTSIDVIAGNIIKLDINRDPIKRIPITIVIDVKTASKHKYRFVLIPIACAKTSSNVTANNSR